MGSSDAARRAGMKVASIETVGTINPTAIATSGPWSANELNRVEKIRGRGNARSRPIEQPVAESIAPCRKTRLTTFPWWAPNATRIPISRVRWVTEYAITP